MLNLLAISMNDSVDSPSNKDSAILTKAQIPPKRTSNKIIHGTTGIKGIIAESTLKGFIVFLLLKELVTGSTLVDNLNFVNLEL